MTRALLPLHSAGADLALLHEALVAADADLAHLTLDTPAGQDVIDDITSAIGGRAARSIVLPD